MTVKQKAVILGLIIASVALFGYSVGLYFYKKIRARRSPELYRRTSLKVTLVFSGFLVLAIWCFRLAVGYFLIIVPQNDGQTLFWGEEILNSMFKSFRTFSINEEYAEYVIAMKNMVTAMLPEGFENAVIFRTLAVVYASTLDVIAPIMGGAIVLEVLSGVFPQVKLFFANLNFLSKKYYFSELNEASLALAKSIVKEQTKRKPILIFTDTHIDNENERDYEILSEAKKYGAICLRDDLAHVRKFNGSKSEYYLIDEDEFGNMTALVELCKDENVKHIKDARIYIFVQSDAYVQIEKKVKQRLKENTKLFKAGGLPTIVPVDGFHNLVCNLFNEVPLYEPLIQKKDGNLSVTIFGNGTIGTEAFLNAYWFGQMLVKGEDKQQLKECNLTINIISKDEEETFWSKIDYVNPEIRASVDCIKKGEHTPHILEYNSTGEKNNYYCKVVYNKQDVKIGGFWNEESKDFLDADYFIVALGDDADNISIAEKLRLYVGKRKLEAENANKDIKNTVITYAVFDSELAETLNKQTCYRSCVREKADIFMYAFGSMDAVYSCENVYMSKSRLLAEGINNAYLRAQLHLNHITENIKRSVNAADSNYKHWADLARAMHVKYKVFSLGMLEKSIFDYDDEEEHKKYVREQCDLYKRITLVKDPERLSADIRPLYDSIYSKKQILAWLEHRRWNAFTRTMGYRYTDKISQNLELNGSTPKNMELKLHPCLCEAKWPDTDNGENYQRTDLSEYLEKYGEEYKGDKRLEMIEFLEKAKEFFENRYQKLLSLNIDALDSLDKQTLLWCREAARKDSEKISQKLQELKNDNRETVEDKIKFIVCYDFKTYDYYDHEFSATFSVEEAAILLGRNSKALAKACKRGKVDGVICIGNSNWYVPLSWINSERKKSMHPELNYETAMEELKK